MDPLTVQFKNFAIANKPGVKSIDSVGGGMKTPLSPIHPLGPHINDNANKNVEKEKDDIVSIKNTLAALNHRNYLENLSKISVLGGGKHLVQSLIEARAALLNSSTQSQNNGEGGESAFLRSLLPGSSALNAINALALNLPQLLGENAFRDMGINLNSFRLTEGARKQLIEQQFQVEGGTPSVGDFSRKVFVGGLPPDIFESAIQERFSEFGPLTVDWPHKLELNSIYPPKGYAFLLYSEDESVRRLISSCVTEEGRLYISISSQTMKNKPVQIRPWRLPDADYVPDMNITLDPRKTVFIGGVPRPIRAYDLAIIMNRLFGGVCYAGIDTDAEFKYPKGAGRVTFYNHHSYVAAISARFVQLQHEDIDKRVEVKPYVLDDQQCDECQGKTCNYKYASFFCSNVACLRYYCDDCWQLVHSTPGREYHKPLVKEGNERPRAVPYRWRADHSQCS